MKETAPNHRAMAGVVGGAHPLSTEGGPRLERKFWVVSFPEFQEKPEICIFTLNL
jgi:hypothetical protein